MCLVHVRALVLLLILVACGDARPSGLRVASYNVNFGVAGDASTIAAMLGTEADIVLLQETNARWEQAILSRIGKTYPHRQFTPSERIAGGMAVLSRYPITKLETLQAPDAPFFATRMVIDSPLGALQIFNVHLRPPMSDGGSWVAGYFTTRGPRLREMLHYMQAFDPALPTVIAGDFNEEADGLAMLALKDRGFSDAIATFHGAAPTWAWNARGVVLRFQLDHILHDARLVPMRAAIVDAGRSDHKPIHADFRLRTEPAR